MSKLDRIFNQMFSRQQYKLCVLVYLQQEELQEQNNNKNLGASDYGRANESMYIDI